MRCTWRKNEQEQQKNAKETCFENRHTKDKAKHARYKEDDERFAINPWAEALQRKRKELKEEKESAERHAKRRLVATFVEEQKGEEVAWMPEPTSEPTGPSPTLNPTAAEDEQETAWAVELLAVVGGG